MSAHRSMEQATSESVQIHLHISGMLESIETRWLPDGD
jgi:hypothetical protein